MPRTFHEPCADYEEALTIVGMMRAAFPRAIVRILTPALAGMWGVSVTL